MTEEIATLQSSSTRAAVDAKTANRKISQLESKIAKDEQEAEATLKLIEELKAGFAELEGGAKAVQEELKQASLLMEEQEERMNALQTAVDEATAAVNRLRSSLVDVEHDLHEKERAFNEHSSSAKGWEKKLDNLKLHEYVVDVGVEELEMLFFYSRLISSHSLFPSPCFLSSLSLEDEEEEAEEPVAAEAGQDEAATASAEGNPEAAPKAKRAKAAQELQMLSAEQLAELDQNDLQCNVTVLEEKLKQLKPNMSAIREYKKKEQDYLARVQELDAVTTERDNLRKHYEV